VFAIWLGWLLVSGRIDPGVELHEITSLYVLDSMLTSNVEALRSALAT